MQCCGPHHFDADPNPAFHFDAGPDLDLIFQSDADGSRSYLSIWCGSGPDPTANFSPDLNPPMLQNDSLRLQPFHFDADLDPAFHFDVDPDPASPFDADPDPVS
jgi:hypothetical protein